MGRDQKNNQVPFLYDSTTGRICGLRHPDGTEEFIVMANVKTGTPVNGVKAALTSNMTNANADVTLTAVNYGADGNRISVTYVDPGAINQALKVLVNGENIIVNLATNGAGAITSICNAVVAAINAHEDAKLLVVATAEGTGLGVVNDLVLANLAGGVTTTPGVPGSTLMKDSSGFLWLKTGEQTWTSFTSTIVDATTTVKGKVELATDTETTTGTSTTVVLTPSNLSARTATESRRGIIELATVAEVLAGVDTERAVTPVGVNAFMTAGDAVTKNPLMYSQGINMTYAASASGIQVADNDNIDFGTGDFTLVWKGSLPDWSPSVNSLMFYKNVVGEGGCQMYASSSAKYGFYLRDASGIFINLDSIYPISFVDGTVHEIVYVVTRETATADGSCAIYADGILVTTISIAAGAGGSISNSGTMYVSGYNTVRNASNTIFAATYNRALSAAEVLDLYRNGINFADKWGSQKSLVINATDNMAADNTANWTPTGASIAFDTDHYELTSVGGGTSELECACSGLTIGKKYRWVIKIKNGTDAGIVCTPLIRNNADSATIATGTAKTTGAAYVEMSVEWTATEANNLVKLQAAAMTDTNNIELDDSAVYEIGATLALEPQGIQPAPGQWLDSSTNKLHAMQPAAGSSLIRSKREFEIRWTNTWAGTHGAQYVGGINQAILPPGCYITSYVYVIAGTTIEDVIIGDGSDTDRWVTITAGLAAGTGEFTLANKISDGTNYKVVIDPDSNFTGSITSIIKGVILT